MELGLAITLAALSIVVVVILAIIIYNQMLLLNEVNKRLLLMTKESIEKERITMEELQASLNTQMEASTTPGYNAPESERIIEEQFDPHRYEEQLP